jgi:hypothetical protein
VLASVSKSFTSTNTSEENYPPQLRKWDAFPGETDVHIVSRYLTSVVQVLHVAVGLAFAWPLPAMPSALTPYSP